MNLIQELDTIKILLPLRAIPDGTTVVKRGGTYPLKVCRTIRLYNHEVEGQHTIITAREGTVFLISEGQNMNLNAHPDTMEVVWELPVTSLYDILEADQMEADSK